jgi:ATP-dependent exoDNAse (exonuclease V) alpha subunit
MGRPLSPEQHHALEVLTGPGRAAVLVGPAGTGKGVVIDAVARAEQYARRETIGVAVSGSTAERLGVDSPALAGRTLTLDALVARANTGTVQVGRDTTVILDEAGMVDHKRLDALTDLVVRSGAKLVAVGDGKQLPSIGPGGMFDRLAIHAPTAELADIHRTKDPAEQRAWRALRSSEPEQAMAHYLHRGQLYFNDTGEAAVQRWHTLTQQHGIREVALIADASNREIDRLNARAQHLRAQHGELGIARRNCPTSTTASVTGISSPSPGSTVRPDSHESRTALAARSSPSTSAAPRSRSTVQTVASTSPGPTSTRFASPTPSTSTASRALRSSAR